MRCLPLLECTAFERKIFEHSSQFSQTDREHPHWIQKIRKWNQSDSFEIDSIFWKQLHGCCWTDPLNGESGHSHQCEVVLLLDWFGRKLRGTVKSRIWPFARLIGLLRGKPRIGDIRGYFGHIADNIRESSGCTTHYIKPRSTITLVREGDRSRNYGHIKYDYRASFQARLCKSLFHLLSAAIFLRLRLFWNEKGRILMKKILHFSAANPTRSVNESIQRKWAENLRWTTSEKKIPSLRSRKTSEETPKAAAEPVERWTMRRADDDVLSPATSAE